MGNHTDQEKIDVVKNLMRAHDALTDLLDGKDWIDIQSETGLPKERCKEIVKLTCTHGEYDLMQMMGLPNL